MNDQKHPMDFDALNKGAFISPAEVERIMGVPQSNVARFTLAGLRLRAIIHRQLRIRDRPATCVCRKGGIAVLTDSEAAVYNAKRFRHGLRHSARSYRRAVSVDVTQLTEEERRDHDRNLVLNSRILSAVARERKNAIASAHQRVVPTLEAK